MRGRLRYEHRLKSQAEPPPLDAALAQQGIEHPINRLARSYEDLPPRTEGRDAEKTTSGSIDHRPSLVSIG